MELQKWMKIFGTKYKYQIFERKKKKIYAQSTPEYNFQLYLDN